MPRKRKIPSAEDAARAWAQEHTASLRSFSQNSDQRLIRVTQRDGSIWGVPFMVAARDRAANYASEYGGDLERSLREDTLRLEDGDIVDWATNNMNWSDVRAHAVRLSGPAPLTEDDFQEAWVNGEKEVY